MNTEPHEILSSFVDGESTDPDVLANALTQPGAIDALVDFVRMRAALREDRAVPSPRMRAAIDGVFAGTSPRPAGRFRSVTLGLVAAVLFGIGIAAGWAIHTTSKLTAYETPPAPTREVHFTPGVDWHGRS